MSLWTCVETRKNQPNSRQTRFFSSSQHHFDMTDMVVIVMVFLWLRFSLSREYENTQCPVVEWDPTHLDVYGALVYSHDINEVHHSHMVDIDCWFEETKTSDSKRIWSDNSIREFDLSHINKRHHTSWRPEKEETRRRFSRVSVVLLVRGVPDYSS
jgi:hypothetical protein